MKIDYATNSVPMIRSSFKGGEIVDFGDLTVYFLDGNLFVEFNGGLQYHEMEIPIELLKELIGEK